MMKSAEDGPCDDLAVSPDRPMVGRILTQRQPQKPRGRPGGRSARVREAVLQAAFALLAEKGFEALSIAEVAAHAGVHETSIYRRWGTKNALALEASLHFARSAIPIPDTGSLRSDLVALLKGLLALLGSPQGQTLLMLGFSQHPHVVAARQDFWRSRRESLRPVFERAVGRSEFPRDADPMLLLETLIAPLYLRRLVTGEPLEKWPYEAAIDRLLATFAP
jgi:AcrR family transcriptional regulator